MITVVVVDDHPFFRDGVARGLASSGEIRVVGEAENGRENIDVIATEDPDVAVVDYKMLDIDGIGVVHAIKRDGLRTRVLLLSAATDSAIVFKADAGGRGRVSVQGCPPGGSDRRCPAGRPR